jgi:hypothetical protein
MKFIIPAHETVYFQEWIKLRNFYEPASKPRDAIARERGIVNRVLDIQKLKESEKQHVFALLDAFIKQTNFQSIM